MSLAEYRKKRDFTKTREPRSRKSRAKPAARAPIFVVQEHWASHHHFDFRLEAFGALKSWAVPKGPSSVVGEKRLAVEVEDHPIDYAKFEGEIPEGEYGAGHVEIWDKGTWIPPENLKESLRSGHLEFELKGKRLRGSWLLQRTKRGAGNKSQWLLIKRPNKGDERTKLSLITPRTLKTVHAKSPWPHEINPQLALLVDQVPSGPQWIHEMKWDGYRTLVEIDGGKIQFLTRNGLDWTDRYAPLSPEFKKIRVKNAIFDGEIAASEDGKRQPSFTALQTALKDSDFSRVVYLAFDLLYYNGKDLRGEPLEWRKQLLKKILSRVKSKKIQYSQHWRAEGEILFERACQEGWEGIVSKNRDLPYIPGRSGAWQKIKCSRRQEFVIGGWTDPEGKRAGLGALLLGVYEHGKFRYVGKVGTGFNARNIPDVMQRLREIAAPNSPFQVSAPPQRAGVHWVKPQWVAEIQFKTWTKDRCLRQTSFLGLREDKLARAVHLEVPKHIEPAPGKGANPETNFKVSHPGRMIYPRQKVTKLNVANYYKTVAPWLMPYIQDRPLSLVRCPESAGEGCFYQKHIGNTRLPGVQEFLIEDQKVIAIQSEEGLLQLIQWGVLEFHGWQCSGDSPTNPDQIVFDLDPDETVEWESVVETAFLLKTLLKKISLQSFVKTTGGKGLHLHVPIAKNYGFERVKAFAKSVVLYMEVEYPVLYTTSALKKLRKGKIFLDYLRNGFGATSVIPYSLRAKDSPAVAMPLRWEELRKLKGPAEFVLDSVLSRLARQRKDPWPEYHQLRQKLKILG